MPFTRLTASRRNGRPFHPLARFFAWYVSSQMVFESAIWILFLQDRGFSLAEIGIAEAGFHLAPVLLEIPSGSFADLVGRRWSLATGPLLVALSSILLWHAHSLPIAVLALFVSGANYSFRSGADQAYLYDALAIDEQGGFARLFGRLLSAGYLIGGGAALLGAVLSEWSYAWPIGLNVVTSLLGVALAIGLPEASRARTHEDRQDRRSFRRHIVDVRLLLRAQPVVARMLLVAALFWTTLAIAGLYTQAAFSEQGLSNGQIGLVSGFTWVAIAAGTTIGGRLGGSFARQWPVLTGATALGVALTGIDAIAVAVVAFLLWQLVSGVIETRLAGWYNERLPSAQRATVISIEGWLFSCLMLGLFPAGGWLAGRLGWPALYLACGAVGAATALAGIMLRRHDNPVEPVAPAEGIATVAPPNVRETTS